jgi:hypothetical protein
MPLLETSLSAPWQYYADRAREAHLGRADFFGLGREEQLWATLDVIESEIPFDEECRKRLDRIPQNRAKKHIRLLKKLADFAHASVPIEQPLVELQDEVEAVELHLSLAEWDVERRLAAGETYSDVAPDKGISDAALKVRVSRWRTRVRQSVAINAA